MSDEGTPEVIEPGRLYSKAEVSQRLRPYFSRISRLILA